MAGVNTTLASERNSYYAGKQPTAPDAGSVRSGFAGHNLNDSIGGSMGTNIIPNSPLTSPRDFVVPRSEDLTQSEAVYDKDEKANDGHYKSQDIERMLNDVGK